MRKHIAIFLMFIMCFCILLNGCTKEQTQGESDMGSMTFDQWERGPKPDGQGDFRMEGRNIGTYTPLVVDVNELFSDRDLECNPDISEATTIVACDDSEFVIEAEGVYILSGEAHNFTVKVEADMEDKVQIVLADAYISNDDFPIIYVKSADKCFVTLMRENDLSVNNDFMADGDINTDAVIFSKADLTVNGTGMLSITSPFGNGITSKDDMKITGGVYTIECSNDALEAGGSTSIYDGSFTIEAGSDGVQAKGYLIVNGGIFNIKAAEGMEATYVQINGGEININASDDGINAAAKSEKYDVVIEINGGDITVVMGPGDTDGLDANGIIVVNGGTIDVTGGSTFDSDMGSIYNGGIIIVNGTKVDEIPASEMGRPGERPGERPGDGRPAGGGGF